MAHSKVKKTARDSLLSSIYYDPAHPGSFSSPLRLYEYAKPIDPSITLRNVKVWLSGEKTYVLHKATRTIFPRRKIVVKGRRQQYQADLMDVSALRGYNQRVRYLLVMIDCFSRLLAVIPMKNKKKETSLEAIQEAFRKLGGPPKKLQTDKGTEFTNHLVQDYLRKKKIVFFFTYQDDIKASMAERVIRTLRNKINKIITAQNSMRYLPFLQDVVDSYNNRKHAAFHEIFSPNEITDKNESEIFNLLYKDYLKSNNKNRIEPLHVGDFVLLAIEKKSEPLLKLVTTYYEDVYKIDKVVTDTDPTTYKLRYVSNGALKDGQYYIEQLQKLSPHYLLKNPQKK